MTSFALPHAGASARLARRRLVDELVKLGWARQRAADAGLVLTELIGNAVRHALPRADGSIGIGWREHEGRVRLWVADGGSPDGRPTAQDARPDEVRGRGLAIVAALTERWGVRYEGAVTTVWAELIGPRPSPSPS